MKINKLIFAIVCLLFVSAICEAVRVNPKDPATPINLPKIEALSDSRLITDLSNGAFIFSPNDEGYLSIARDIKQRLESMSAAKYEIIISIEQLNEFKNSNGIVLGNMMNNKLLAFCYWNNYSLVTPAYPGADGYVIETINRPLPILPQSCIIAVCASNLESTVKAAKRFVDMTIDGFSSLKFEPLLIVERSDVSFEDFKDYPETPDLLRTFRRYSHRYHLTGRLDYLHSSFLALEKKVRQAEADDDWVLLWAEELDAYKAMLNWDFVREHALAHNILSETDCVRYEQFFLNLINRLIIRSERFDDITPKENTLGWNHTSIPMAGIYTIARYFKTHYPGFESDLKVCLDKSRWYFMGQTPNYRISCDATLYQSLSLKYILAYYLMTDSMEYFDNSNALQMLRLAISQIDNNGFYAGTGDAAGAYLPFENFPLEKKEQKNSDKGQSLNPLKEKLFAWFDDMPATDMINYYYKLPELYWFAGLPDAKIQSNAVASYNSFFYPELAPQIPQYLIGAVAIPLDKGFYDYISQCNIFRMTPVGYLPFAPPSYPHELCFDKLQFRSVTPSGGEYLLVDGLGRGNHQHFDTNAIVTCVLGGYKFLCDADYLISKSNEHSMLCVVKDGLSPAPVPAVAGLESLADFEDCAYSCSVVKDYNGVDWKRHIYWQKDGYYLVIDTATANQDGQYFFENIWKVLDRNMESFDGQNLVCKAPAFENVSILNPITDFPPQTFHLRSADKQSNWWNSRVCTRYSIPTHKVHQNKIRDLKISDTISFQNVFYIEKQNANGNVVHYIPYRLNQKSMIVESQGVNNFVIVDSGEYDGVLLDGGFALISPDNIVLSDVRKLSVNGKSVFNSQLPISVNIKSDNVYISADRTGMCSFFVNNNFYRVEYKQGVSEHKLPVNITSLIAAIIDVKRPVVDNTDPQKISIDAKPLVIRSRQDGFSQALAADIAVGRLSDDREPLVVIAYADKLICQTLSGEQLWIYEISYNPLSVAIGKLANADSTSVVVCGTDNNRVIVLDCEGKLYHSFDIDVKSSGHFGIQDSKPWITSVYMYDIDEDGRNEIFAGCKSWQIQMFSNFELKWYNSMIWHGVWDVKFRDMDGDGRDDMVIGDRYGAVNILSIDDKPLAVRRNSTAIGDVYVDTIDIDNDGRLEVINASDGGKLTVFKRTSEDIKTFEPVWRFDNWGFGYTGVGVLRKEFIIVSSESGFVYYLDKQGRVVNKAYLFSPITALFCGDDSVFCGTEQGNVFKLNVDGDIDSWAGLTGKIVRIKNACDNLVTIMDVYGTTLILEQ